MTCSGDAGFDSLNEVADGYRGARAGKSASPRRVDLAAYGDDDDYDRYGYTDGLGEVSAGYRAASPLAPSDLFFDPASAPRGGMQDD